MISFSSLPLSRPRSYQIAKLLAHIKGKYILITSDYSKSEDIDSSLDAFYSIPSEQRIAIKEKANSYLKKILFVIFPVLAEIPDKHIFWFFPVVKAAKRLRSVINPKSIIAFSAPRTDLLIGVQLKKIFRVPLIVHLSDPWVDNPYVTYKGLKKWANNYLEAWVMKNADLILFTNEDQRALVMRKYTADIQKKARVIAHCYDERLYGEPQAKSEKFIIRHMGNLYGQRSPMPFLEALKNLVTEHPEIAGKMVVEFYGQISPALKEAIFSYSLHGIVKIKPSVPYLESLRLMAGSDLLLLIDAESSHNIFFPSKLVDYMGAKKNILGITSSKGPSADIIKAYGGRSFQHGEVDQLKDFLVKVVVQDFCFIPNGSEVKKYNAALISDEFENMICSLLR